MKTRDSIKGMSIAQLNELLDKVTYRPDFSLAVHDNWDESPCVILSMFVINTYHPENPKMPLTMHQVVPGFVESVEDFYDWCLGIYVWFEEHESREWFKVNGIPWRDPHKYPSQPFVAREVFQRAVNMRPDPMTIPRLMTFATSGT